MTEFKHSALVLAVSVSFALVGCGGSSSSSSSDESGAAETRTITAIDGYLANADVYIDSNNNGKHDAGEKKVGTTDKNGTLEVPVDQFAQPLVVVAVENQTRDSDSGIVDAGFSLTATAGSEYITPFTDLAKRTGKSIAEMAEALGVEPSILAGDYIKAKGNADQVEQAKVVHALARFIVAETKQDTAVEVIESNLGSAKDEIDRQVAEGDKDADYIELDLEDNGGFTTVEPTRLAFTDSDLQDTSWAMFRFDDSGDNEQFYIRFGNANDPDGFCIENESFGFLYKDEGVSPQDEACVPEMAFSISADGKLLLDGDDERKAFTMLFRHTEGDISTFVMVSELGELFWLDNHNELEDAGDFVINNDVTYYQFGDDDSSRDEIEYIWGHKTYKVTGADNYSVSGESVSLNKGDLELRAMGESGADTTFKTVPLYEMMGWEPTDDDILITVGAKSSPDDHEHWILQYRTAGDLSLMLDYKPSTKRESLYLHSESQALMNELAAEVMARNTGKQGDQ